jgi:hypothetical protein
MIFATVTAIEVEANTNSILPLRFVQPQGTHISVSLAKTFEVSRHIVLTAASQSGLWLPRIWVGGEFWR